MYAYKDLWFQSAMISNHIVSYQPQITNIFINAFIAYLQPNKIFTFF